MAIRIYRNKSDIDPSQAMIDPQIDGASLSIHQPPSGESCYWGQVVRGCELKLLDSWGLLIIGCHSQIDTPAVSIRHSHSNWSKLWNLKDNKQSPESSGCQDVAVF